MCSTGEGLARIHLRDQLADAVDHHVLVVDRRQPLHRGGDLHRRALVRVGQDAPVGPRREREDRVLHRGHVVLGDRVEHVADEEIRRRMAVGQQRRARGGGRGRAGGIGALGMARGSSAPLRGFGIAGARFVVSMTLRPCFVVSFTSSGFIVVSDSLQRGSGIAPTWFRSQHLARAPEIAIPVQIRGMPESDNRLTQTLTPSNTQRTLAECRARPRQWRCDCRGE